MDELSILKAEHDIITESYDWISDISKSGEGRIQYMLGVHDMAGFLLNMLKPETKANEE